MDAVGIRDVTDEKDGRYVVTIVIQLRQGIASLHKAENRRLFVSPPFIESTILILQKVPCVLSASPSHLLTLASV